MSTSKSEQICVTFSLLSTDSSTSTFSTLLYFSCMAPYRLQPLATSCPLSYNTNVTLLATSTCFTDRLLPSRIFFTDFCRAFDADTHSSPY